MLLTALHNVPVAQHQLPIANQLAKFHLPKKSNYINLSTFWRVDPLRFLFLYRESLVFLKSNIIVMERQMDHWTNFSALKSDFGKVG